MRKVFMALFCVTVFFSGLATGAQQNPSDDEIRQVLIRQSIARYSGNCPCPYNTDSAGRRCGKRSAYSRPGGASPLCYPSDITEEMIARYRATHGGDSTNVRR